MRKNTAISFFVGASTAAAVAYLRARRAGLFTPHWIEDVTHNDVLFHVNTNERVIALTIDDGPHAAVTPHILDVLAEHDARATFFIIGERVAGNEALLERMVAEGHELGNHMWRDARSIFLPETEFKRQLDDTHQLLTQFAPIRWFRPGSGWYNQRMLQHIQKYGYDCAIGTVYPYDAQLPFVEFMSNYILKNTVPGSVVILHDGTRPRLRTATILGRVLPPLLADGYRVVTLSGLAAKAGELTTARNI